MTVEGFHPGGANVGFCAGSVRFVKDTIDSVGYDPMTGLSAVCRPDRSRGIDAIAPGEKLGVWQKLTARNVGVVVENGEC